tara:strand:+ start:1238 stop:1987 length:750 start_codon:yes stop_codon:yes gene_type:complete
MSWVMAGVASAQLTYAVYQGIVANEEKKDAEKAAEEAIQNYKKIETKNVMGALQIPTKGIELEERNLSRATSGQVDAMQEAGAAGVIGGTGRLTQAVGAQSESQAARVERMQADRDIIVLNEEQRLERERANRLRNVEMMRLQGAQGAAAAAANQQQMAMQSGVDALGTGATAVSASQNPYGRQGPGELQQVETRGVESLSGASASSQPQFQDVYYNSLGQPISQSQATSQADYNNMNYSAFGYFGGNP